MWNVPGARKVAMTLIVSASSISIVACGGSETLVVLNADSPEPLTPLTSFYIEARIELTPGDAQAASSVFSSDGPVITDLRWWFEAPGRFRRESLALEPPYLTDSSFIVSDGSTWLSYYSNLNRYQSAPAIQFPEGTVPAPLSGVIIGPLPGGSVEAWLEGIRRASPRFDARLIRVDELLDHRVGVYEFSDVGVLLDTEGTVAVGSVGRIWVDQSSGFVLKYESPADAGRERVIAEVTELVLNSDIEDDRFTFEPPLGAIEVVSSGGPIVLGGSTGGPGAITDTGLLQIGRVPTDLIGSAALMGSGSSSMGTVETAENTWTESGGRALRIRQKMRVSGLPEIYMGGEQVSSSAATHGSSYFVLRSDDEEMTTLAWQNGDVTVVMDGLSMELNELMRVADSMILPGTVVAPES